MECREREHEEGGNVKRNQTAAKLKWSRWWWHCRVSLNTHCIYVCAGSTLMSSGALIERHNTAAAKPSSATLTVFFALIQFIIIIITTWKDFTFKIQRARERIFSLSFFSRMSSSPLSLAFKLCRICLCRQRRRRSFVAWVMLAREVGSVLLCVKCKVENERIDG